MWFRKFRLARATPIYLLYFHTQELDSEALNTLKDTIKALKDEQEHHHDQLNKLSDDATQKDLHLKVITDLLCDVVCLTGRNRMIEINFW